MEEGTLLRYLQMSPPNPNRSDARPPKREPDDRFGHLKAMFRGKVDLEDRFKSSEPAHTEPMEVIDSPNTLTPPTSSTTGY